MRVPFAQLISSSGIDLFAAWGPRVISMSIVDERGAESDKLTVELDNLDQMTQSPDPGEIVQAVLGYEGEGGIVAGTYEIDTVDDEFMPDKIVINATALSAKGAAKERKNEAHKKKDTPTVGDLVKKIAGRNELSPRVHPSIASIKVEYEAQAAESDLAFLNRILDRYDGFVGVKQGNLVAGKKGAMQSMSGAPLAPIVISRGLNLISGRVSRKKKPEHGKAQANVFDRKKVKRVDVDAGGGSITYRFRQPFKNEDEAKKAAEGQLSALARGEASATFEIEGEPAAAAECPVLCVNVSPVADRLWNAIKVTHSISGKYTTSIECELPGAK